MDAPTRFRAWRAAARLSQIEAAVLIGCHQATICRIEAGAIPGIETAEAIERVTAGHELAVRACEWAAPAPPEHQAAEPAATGTEG